MKKIFIALLCIFPMQLFAQWDGAAWDGVGRFGTAATSYPLLDNLVFYYGFDGQSGVDYTAHRYDLTNAGGTTFSTTIAKYGYAARFDQSGTDDYLYYPVNLSDSIDFSQPFTMYWWSSFDDFVDIRAFIASDSTGSDGLLVFYFDTPDSIRTDVGGTYIQFDNTLSADSLYFYCLRYDGTTLKFWLDEDTVSTAVTIPAEEHNLTIGSGNSGAGTQQSRLMKGYMDEIALHNTNLSDDLIRWIYNENAGRSYSEQITYTGSGTPLSTLNNDLIAFYNLEDVTDEAGSLDLTNNAATVFAAGKIDNAADFEDASSQYLSYADDDVFSLSAGESITISCWVNAEAFVTPNKPLVSKWYDNGSTERWKEYGMDVDENEVRIYVSNDGAASVTLTATPTFSASTWYHVVGIFDNDTDSLKIIINNTDEYGASGASGNIPNGGQGFFIGATRFSSGTWRYFDGLIDAVGVWRRVLTAAEITELYNSGTGIQYPFQ